MSGRQLNQGLSIIPELISYFPLGTQIKLIDPLTTTVNISLFLKIIRVLLFCSFRNLRSNTTCIQGNNKVIKHCLVIIFERGDNIHCQIVASLDTLAILESSITGYKFYSKLVGG